MIQEHTKAVVDSARTVSLFRSFLCQECLVQWLKYSKKEFCELCKHRYSFTPIYAPDMPKRLPVADILSGLMRSVATAVKFWIHYTVVAFMWLGVVPLMSCRIYRCLFTGEESNGFALNAGVGSSGEG